MFFHTQIREIYLSSHPFSGLLPIPIFRISRTYGGIT